MNKRQEAAFARADKLIQRRRDRELLERGFTHHGILWEWFPGEQAGEIIVQGGRYTCKLDDKRLLLINDDLRRVLEHLEQEARSSEP
jgi:hypothetical protein